MKTIRINTTRRKSTAKPASSSSISKSQSTTTDCLADKSARSLTIVIFGEGRASGKTMLQMELYRILAGQGHSVSISDYDCTTNPHKLTCSTEAYRGVLEGRSKLKPVNVHIHISAKRNVMKTARDAWQRLA